MQQVLAAVRTGPGKTEPRACAGSEIPVNVAVPFQPGFDPRRPPFGAAGAVPRLCVHFRPFQG
ncbi:MAG: hypothetical protein IT514_05795 [Burkholderiales bacterium]|nr:hypothetical protein [Burkholderiales bacterium]